MSSIQICLGFQVLSVFVSKTKRDTRQTFYVVTKVTGDRGIR